MPQNSSQPKPSSQPPQPLSLQEKHDQTLKQVTRWTKAAALPDLTAGERELAISMRRSTLAALICYRKALEYARPHSDPEVEQRLRLYRLFRLPLPAPIGG